MDGSKVLYGLEQLKTMKTYVFTPLLRSLAMAALLTATAAFAADVNGSWTWTMPGRNGGPERTSKLTLKAEGSKLTGKIAAPGRDGAVNETPIAEGKLDGENLSFVVVREYNGNSNTNRYNGKLSGDKIVGKVEFSRNGEKQSRDWEAKRATESK